MTAKLFNSTVLFKYFYVSKGKRCQSIKQCLLIFYQNLKDCQRSWPKPNRKQKQHTNNQTKKQNKTKTKSKTTTTKKSQTHTHTHTHTHTQKKKTVRGLQP